MPRIEQPPWHLHAQLRSSVERSHRRGKMTLRVGDVTSAQGITCVFSTTESFTDVATAYCDKMSWD